MKSDKDHYIELKKIEKLEAIIQFLSGVSLSFGVVFFIGDQSYREIIERLNFQDSSSFLIPYLKFITAIAFLCLLISLVTAINKAKKRSIGRSLGLLIPFLLLSFIEVRYLSEFDWILLIFPFFLLGLIFYSKIRFKEGELWRSRIQIDDNKMDLELDPLQLKELTSYLEEKSILRWWACLLIYCAGLFKFLS